MKLAFLVFLAAVGAILRGGTIVVSPMKHVPDTVRGFANDLYAEVTTEKELIELFLRHGKPKQELSEADSEYDEENSIQNPIEEDADGNQSLSFLLHGCNGVFTDKDDVVYLWRLSSPRVLALTSQKSEFVFLVLDREHLELIHGYKREANKPVETTSVPRTENRESWPFAVAPCSVSHG